MLFISYLFQVAATGSPADYASLEETCASVMLQPVADWVVRHGK